MERPQGSDSLGREIFEAARSAPGRILLSWTMAGGVVAGGMFVVAAGWRGGGGGHLSAVPILFALGSAAGLAHGALLAVVGRPPERTRIEALKALLGVSLFVLPALAVSWVVTAWISFTHSFATTGNGPGMVAAGLAWITGVALCLWAAREGWRGVWRGYTRWPEARAGSFLLAVILAALLIFFSLRRPEVWGTELQVTGLGAIVLAFGATIWIAMPVVITTLHYIHLWAAPAPHDGRGSVSRW